MCTNGLGNRSKQHFTSTKDQKAKDGLNLQSTDNKLHSKAVLKI